MYKAKGIRDKKGKLVGGAYMMKNRAGDQAITAETGAYNDGIRVRYLVQSYSSSRENCAAAVLRLLYECIAPICAFVYGTRTRTALEFDICAEYVLYANFNCWAVQYLVSSERLTLRPSRV